MHSIPIAPAPSTSARPGAPRLAAADRLHVAQRAGADRRRLGEHAEPPERLGHRDDVLGGHDGQLGGEAVQARDAVLGVVAGVARVRRARPRTRCSARTSAGRSRSRGRRGRSRGRRARRGRAARGPRISRSSPAGGMPNQPSEISRSVPQTPTSTGRTSTSSPAGRGSGIVGHRGRAAHAGPGDERLHQPARAGRARRTPRAVGGRADAARGSGRARRAAARRRAASSPPAGARARRRGRSTCSVPGVGVDRDHVAVAHRRERAAAERLGRDVADHQPARRAGEAAVGDERDRLAEPDADDRRRHAQHLAHPRPAGRALVADDQHVAGLRPGPSRTAATQSASASNTRAGPVWRVRSVPASLTRLPSGARLPRSVRSAPAGLYGAAQGNSTSPSGAGRAGRRRRPASLPATVGASPSSEPAGDQLADQRRRAARAVQRLGDVAAAGRQAREHRRARGERGQLVLRQLDARLARDRQQVQHAVGRAAAGRDAGHRVEQRAAVEERARGRARRRRARPPARPRAPRPPPSPRGPRPGSARRRARPARGSRSPSPSCSR